MLLCFFGFFHLGKYAPPLGAVRLNHSSVCSIDSIVNPKQLSIQLKQSKTEPFGKCVQMSVGKMGGQLCLVAAVLIWMMKIENTEGKLLYFNSATICDGIVESPSLHWRVSQQAGSHSFRSGAATTAA